MKILQAHKPRQWLIAAGIALTGLVLVACETVNTTQGGAVGVNRQQRMAVSQQEVDQQSTLAYNQMKQKAAQQKVLNTDPAVVARVNGIANKLIAQVGVFRPDALKWAWETSVFQSDEVNAFCMAGGKMAVYAGLITKLKITEDELAAVMGHEIAHALREHVREQVSQQQGLSLLSVLGAVATGTDPRAWNTGAQILVGLPHSRHAEVEADQIGLELSARAGYNPKAAITLWQKMGQLGGERPPTFLSTHPSPESRAADLARVADIVMPLYLATQKPAIPATTVAPANQQRR